MKIISKHPESTFLLFLMISCILFVEKGQNDVSFIVLSPILQNILPSATQLFDEEKFELHRKEQGMRSQLLKRRFPRQFPNIDDHLHKKLAKIKTKKVGQFLVFIRANPPSRRITSLIHRQFSEQVLLKIIRGLSIAFIWCTPIAPLSKNIFKKLQANPAIKMDREIIAMLKSNVLKKTQVKTGFTTNMFLVSNMIQGAQFLI